MSSDSVIDAVLTLLTCVKSIDYEHCQLVKQVDELKATVDELQKEIDLLKTAQQATSFVVDSSPPEEDEIKVGDRIRVNYGDGNRFRKGDTGIVVSIDDDDGDLRIDFTESQVGCMRGDGICWVDSEGVIRLEDDKS